MPETTDQSQSAQSLPDAASENNTGASTNNTDSGNAEHSAALENEGEERRFTQADVDSIIARRLKKAVNAELKKLAGETESNPNIEELTKRAEQAEQRARIFETRETIQSFVMDARNKINARPTDLRAIEKLIFAEIEFDENGKPENLKEAIESVRRDAPSLFHTNNDSANGGAGMQTAKAATGMDSLIRSRLGR